MQVQLSAILDMKRLRLRILRCLRLRSTCERCLHVCARICVAHVNQPVKVEPRPQKEILVPLGFL